MTDEIPQEGLITDEKRKKGNQWLIEYLHATLKDSKDDVSALRTKLAITYWVIITLSIVMFALGIVLISVPAVAAFKGDVALLDSVTSAGFGVADLSALFMFRPIERIHGLMGDMSQITLAISAFQEQVALRLLEMDANERETMGQAAENIKDAAKSSLDLIEIYFEAKKPMP